MEPKHLYRFGPYVFDATDGVLTRDGVLVGLGPKAVEILRQFVQYPDRVLTREHLRKTVWPDTFVEDNTIERQISDLRRVLGEGGYIKALRSRGYRFIEQVTAAIEEEPKAGPAVGSPLDAVVVAEPQTSSAFAVLTVADSPGERIRPRRDPHWPLIIKVAVLVLVVAGIGRLLTSWVQPKPPDNPVTTPHIRPSLAVFQFRDQAGRPSDRWLRTAFSEMLQTELATSQELRVSTGEDAARLLREVGSPNPHELSVEELARLRKLGSVDYIATGAFGAIGAAGKRQFRMDIQLRDTSTGELAASLGGTSDEASVFGLIPAAAREIRSRLKLPQPAEPASPPPLLSDGSTDAEGRRLYYEGLALLRTFDAKGAKARFESAERFGSQSGRLQIALADSLAILGYQQKAREYAERAVQLAAGLQNDERLSIEARFRMLKSDWDRATFLYSSLWTVHGDRIDYGLRLADCQMAAGKAKDALLTVGQLRALPGVLGDDPRIDLAEAVAAENLGDFKREQAAATRAADKARAVGAQLILANALLRDSWASNNLSEWKRAIERAENARAIFRTAGDPGGEGRALKSLADAVDDSGEHQRGAALYREAAGIFTTIGHEAALAMALNNLAYALRSQGLLDQAQSNFAASLELSRKLLDPAGEARALNGVAIILWRRGRLAEAEKIYAQALAIHRGRGDRSNAATVLGNLAIVQQDQGHIAEARQSFNDSLLTLRELGDRTGEARTLGNLGELDLRAGDLPSAKTHFLAQLELGRKIPEEKQVAYALHGLGAALTLEGDTTGARAKLVEAASIRRRLEQTGLAAESDLLLGRALIDESQCGQAEGVLRRAAAEFEREEEADLQMLAETHLAKCLYQTGARTEAARLVAKVQRAVHSIEDASIRSALHCNLAESFTLMGKRQEASTHFQRALALGEKFGMSVAALEARLGMTELNPDRRVAAEGLRAIEVQARNNGLGLVARRAASALRRLQAESP